MTGSDEPLVGRAKELAALDDALTAVHEGRRLRAVQLTGDPGIGKSRLLRELVERAEGRGMLVLSGTASELESELPSGSSSMRWTST